MDSNTISRILKVLFQDSNEVLSIVSLPGTIEYISPLVDNILGYKPEEVIGKNIHDLLEGKERTKLDKLLQNALVNSNEMFRDIINIRKKQGPEVQLEVNIRNLLKESSIQGFLLRWRDVSQQIVKEKELAYLANYDQTTEIFNKQRFVQQLVLECKRAEMTKSTLATMIVNIDGLKYHKENLKTRIIQMIARRLKRIFGDEFIGRYSDDQFCIIISGFDTISQYESAASHIIDLLSRPFKIQDFSINISVRIGMSIYPKDSQDAETLLEFAHKAVLKAMTLGQNEYVLYSPELSKKSEVQFLLQNSLNSALINNQFKIYYQPIVDLGSCEVSGAEALIRWEHPTLGLVPPGEFIPLAEETGFIIKLGKWIMWEVCSHYRQWLDEGYAPIKISINLSPLQFLDKDLIKYIKDLLHDFNLDPSFLMIEITESIFIQDFENIKKYTEMLQEIGIQVALDDFGTGFSSFSYLQNFKVDTIKIDRSFIQNVNSNSKSMLITKSIIDLSTNLGIGVVAEGIEEVEQLKFLKDLKCGTGQGYIFSKPITKEVFAQILDRKICNPFPCHPVRRV